MSGTPQQNEIAERRNHMLLDMMDVCLLIPHYLSACGGKALKTTGYILNQVPSKFVLKTPYELCHRRNLVFVTSMFGAIRWK